MVTLNQLIQPEDKKLSPEVQEAVIAMRADPRFKCAALLRAFSVPAEIVSEVFGLSVEEVGQTMLVPEYKALYARWSVRIKEVSSGEIFNRLLPLSVYVQELYLADENTDPKLRVQIAERVVDRVKGRPTQSVELRSVNLNIEAEAGKFDEQIGMMLDRIKQLEDQRNKLKEAQKV